MSLWSATKSALKFGAPRASAESSRSVSLDQMIAALNASTATDSGVGVGPVSSLKHGVVYRSVTLLSGVMASTPLDFLQDSISINHDVRTLLTRKPNPARKQSADQFIRMMEAWVLQHGNAYARIVRSGRRIVALIPIHPLRCDPKETSTGQIVYNVRMPNGGPLRLPQDEIFHLFDLSDDGIRGMSVLEHARQSVGLGMASDKFAGKLFANGAHIGTVAYSNKPISEEGYQHLRRSFEDFRGVENAGRTLVLEQIEKIEKLGMTLADAQFVENKEVTATDIAMFYGIPPFILGLTTKSTSWGSGLAEQMQGFVNFRLADIGKMWSLAIETQLLPDDPKISVRFDYKAMMRGNPEARAKYLETLFRCGAVNPNDIIAIEDLGAPRTDDGGEKYYVMTNMTSNPDGGATAATAAAGISR